MEKEQIQGYISSLDISDARKQLVSNILNGEYMHRDRKGSGTRKVHFNDGTTQRVDTYDGRLKAAIKIVGEENASQLRDMYSSLPVSEKKYTPIAPPVLEFNDYPVTKPSINTENHSVFEGKLEEIVAEKPVQRNYFGRITKEVALYAAASVVALLTASCMGIKNYQETKAPGKIEATSVFREMADAYNEINRSAEENLKPTLPIPQTNSISANTGSLFLITKGNDYVSPAVQTNIVVKQDYSVPQSNSTVKAKSQKSSSKKSIIKNHARVELPAHTAEIPHARWSSNSDKDLEELMKMGEGQSSSNYTNFVSDLKPKSIEMGASRYVKPVNTNTLEAANDYVANILATNTPSRNIIVQPVLTNDVPVVHTDGSNVSLEQKLAPVASVVKEKKIGIFGKVWKSTIGAVVDAAVSHYEERSARMNDYPPKIDSSELGDLSFESMTRSAQEDRAIEEKVIQEEQRLKKKIVSDGVIDTAQEFYGQIPGIEGVTDGDRELIFSMEDNVKGTK